MKVLRNMLRDYITRYIDSSVKELKAMFSVDSTVDNCDYSLNNTVIQQTDYVVQIPFFGEISGDYSLCIEKDRWSRVLKKIYAEQDDEIIVAAVKEYLNIVVGLAVLAFKEEKS